MTEDKSTRIDWLEEIAEPSDLNDFDTVYDLDKLSSKFSVTELFPDKQGWLILDKNDGLSYRWAVMEFHASNSDDTEVKVTCVFHGHGPTDNLRECRHTWWGDKDGYIFYPNGKLISAAFIELSKYYDGMTP